MTRPLNEREAELFGENVALELVLREVIADHPFRPLLRARVERAREQGTAVLLAAEVPDRALDSFGAKLDEISASLPSRAA